MKKEIYPHCKICAHLEQNHEYGNCLACALTILYPYCKKYELKGYCGKNNLKYLEWKYNKQEEGKI